MSQKLFDLIEQKIINDLIAHERPKGYRLPSEAELCETYGCSRQTIRKALGSMAEKGILVSRQGSGSFLAISLTAQRGHDVALIVPAINRFIYPDIASGAEEFLSQSGYRLNLYQAPNEFVMREVFRQLIAKPPAGIILSNSMPYTSLVDYYRQLRSLGVPFVLIDSACHNISDYSNVTMDEFNGGLKAAELLLSAGRRKIYGLFPSVNPAQQKRSAGFLCGLDRENYPITENTSFFFHFIHRPINTFRYSIQLEEIQSQNLSVIRDMLREADGLFIGDLIAESVVNELQKLGRVPGKDISIIAITNSSILNSLHMPISALSHAKERLGIAAAEELIRLLHGEKTQTISIPYPLIDRGSI